MTAVVVARVAAAVAVAAVGRAGRVSHTPAIAVLGGGVHGLAGKIAVVDVGAKAIFSRIAPVVTVGAVLHVAAVPAATESADRSAACLHGHFIGDGGVSYGRFTGLHGGERSCNGAESEEELHIWSGKA